MTPTIRRRSVLLVILLSASPPAFAEGELDRAREAFVRGEFKVTLLRLKEAEANPRLTEEDLVRIHWYRGACLHAQGRKEEAAASFDQVLRLRPLYAPDKLEASPDMRAAFQARADLWRKLHGVELGDPMLSGPAIVVSVVGNAAEVGSVAVFARARGEPSFAEYVLPYSAGEARGPISDVELWKRVGRAGGIELVVEARNPRDVPIARRGDALNPVVLGVSPAMADNVILALAPAPQQPAPPPEQSPPPQSTPIVSDDTEGSSTTPNVGLLGGGIVLLGGGGAAVVVAIVAGAVGAASLIGFVATTDRIRHHDVERPFLVPLFYVTWGLGVGLSVVGGLLFAAAVLSGGIGVGLLLVRMLFS